jgi:hypothetical protein
VVSLALDDEYFRCVRHAANPSLTSYAAACEDAAASSLSRHDFSIS